MRGYQAILRRLDRAIRALRHSRRLENRLWLWDRIRPLYQRGLALAAPNGLERVVNGTDRIRIAPRFGTFPESYEPDLWARLMGDLRPGDTMADIGANIGLYAIAAALRVGPTGHVVAFEPDEENLAGLRENIALNRLLDRVEVVAAAVGATDGKVTFSRRPRFGVACGVA